MCQNVYSHRRDTLSTGRVSVCFFTYQGIEHQSVKGVAVRVLHHDVEESVQSVL